LVAQDNPYGQKNSNEFEIAYLAAFHRLIPKGLLRLKNSVYNLVFAGV